MFIRRAIVTAAVAGALATAVGAGAAGADPGEPGLCNFPLSDPHVIDLSGTPTVTAGLAGRCAELPGYTTTNVYLAPYRPGVTYTAKGRGCAAQTNPPAPVCTTVGPTTATL